MKSSFTATVKRWVLASLPLVFVLCVAAPAPAEAHASLVGSNPNDGTNLADRGASVANGTVTERLRGAAGDGDYTVSYRVVSADSHPVSGSVSFRLTGQGSASAPKTPAQADTASGSTSFLSTPYFAILIAPLLLVSVAVLILIRQPSGEPRAPEHDDAPADTRT